MSIGCQWEPLAGMASGGVPAGSFLGMAGNYGAGGFVNSTVKLSVNIANPCSKLLCTEVREVYQIFRKQTLYV